MTLTLRGAADVIVASLLLMKYYLMFMYLKVKLEQTVVCSLYLWLQMKTYFYPQLFQALLV